MFFFPPCFSQAVIYRRLAEEVINALPKYEDPLKKKT